MFYFETASFGNPAIFICLSIVQLSQQAEGEGDVSETFSPNVKNSDIFHNFNEKKIILVICA